MIKNYHEFIKENIKDIYCLKLEEVDLLCDIDILRDEVISKNNEKISQLYTNFINSGRGLDVFDKAKLNLERELLKYLAKVFDENNIIHINVNLISEHDADGGNYTIHPEITIYGDKEELIKISKHFGMDENKIRKSK